MSDADCAAAQKQMGATWVARISFSILSSEVLC